jgi:hypothetical protein
MQPDILESSTAYTIWDAPINKICLFLGNIQSILEEATLVDDIINNTGIDNNMKNRKIFNRNCFIF